MAHTEQTRELDFGRLWWAAADERTPHPRRGTRLALPSATPAGPRVGRPSAQYRTRGGPLADALLRATGHTDLKDVLGQSHLTPVSKTEST